MNEKKTDATTSVEHAMCLARDLDELATAADNELASAVNSLTRARTQFECGSLGQAQIGAIERLKAACSAIGVEMRRRAFR
jgi:hypothetical protein